MGKQGEGWHTCPGEMSTPQGGRPVLSTANRRGKHLQDKHSAHYLREHWLCRQQDTSPQKHHCSYTWRGFIPKQHLAAKRPLPDSHHATILLGQGLQFNGHIIIFRVALSKRFKCFLKCFGRKLFTIFIENKQRAPSSLGTGYQADLFW